jgi:hypothetical protein
MYHIENKYNEKERKPVVAAIKNDSQGCGLSLKGKASD